MCVQVCPTGIDIRDGLQYECIGCALCIDACDSIMEKMDYTKGLISYTTEHRLEGKTSHVLRPKSIAYALLLSIMIGAFSYTLITRIPLELDIIRDRGALYQLTGMGKIENAFTVKIMNMSDQKQQFELSVTGLEGLNITTKTDITVQSGEIYTLPTSVEVDPEYMKSSTYDIEFIIQSKDDPNLRAESESRFLGSAY